MNTDDEHQSRRVERFLRRVFPGVTARNLSSYRPPEPNVQASRVVARSLYEPLLDLDVVG